MIWNANLDRAPALRRPLSELRADLKKWEDDQARARTAAASGAGAGSALAHEVGAYAYCLSTRPQ